MGLFEKVFGTHSQREVKKLDIIANKIEELEESISPLTDEELKGKTFEFKERIEKGETLDDLLPEAFAVVREASKRVLGQRHYKVQLIGGIVLHQGRIAEMKTGEGKTLVSTLPVYLNALTGKGVHVVTVNDYLAKRDRDWMGQIFEFLGLTVGVIIHDVKNEERREAYACDITYGTNNEYGFDYLRDNMVIYEKDKVQRELNYCVVDEIDSILIDEARTPLIISGKGDKSTELYRVADLFVKTLTETDFDKDEKAHSVTLTEEGIEKAEKFFNIDNFSDPEHMQIQHHVVQALKGNKLMRLDKDYMIKDGEIIIVDEFTGRLMEGRRYSDGLHQAIEAKEGVKVKNESKTLATITFQNYFRMYSKLSGMTGTAETEEQEFREIYGLDVVVIPTNNPIKREDKPDFVYRNKEVKFKAIVEDILESSKIGQPVLVGTTSIENSEELSSYLKKKGIKHEVLNAKYHEREAEIIAKAGERGAITIATNMAGRGTDIKLGEGVEEIGGLKIIGTERHESRRIDNQLRGRSGRQGDKGISRFYLSMDDDLMRIFGSEKTRNMIVGNMDDTPIENKMITNGVESAQKKIEGNNFDIRKSVLGYDDVMNQQRTIIYTQRDRVLKGENLKEQIEKMIENVVQTAVELHQDEHGEIDKENAENLIKYLHEYFLRDESVDADYVLKRSIEELIEDLTQIAKSEYKLREDEFGAEQLREIERVILLRVVDLKWMDHIDNMDILKQGMGLRAYNQKDPVQSFQAEGSEMFEEMNKSIVIDTVKQLFHVRVEQAPEREKVVKEVFTNEGGAGKGTKKVPEKTAGNKVGRNDPCPCGSGLKYKKCCGANA